jgi:redox-sensitive bicupin YhaK (pirin superfamily)
MAQTHTAQKTQAPVLDTPPLKAVSEVRPAPQGHWVGDGFPVRTMFGYDNATAFSPYLLMDYAGPRNFPAAAQRRGVGEHPHRGFETVTLVYSGEVQHRDSSGGGGMIGAGDVQWMTAGSGVVHEEMHSEEFTKSGGVFEAVQLWVNLPARQKMTKPGYQTILKSDIPVVTLPDGAGFVRVIAGAFGTVKGPANTFTPVILWDGQLKAGKGALLQVPEGHNASLFVRRGTLVVNGKPVRASELAVLERGGEAFRVDAEDDVEFVLLGGEPIDEPVFGYGPFVMNNETEIRQAISDYQAGRMGHLK